MAKTVTLQFSIEDKYEEQELRRALNANNAYSALWEIAQEVFRPARKHGYADPKIEQAMQNKELNHEEIVGLLEEKFFDIIRDHNISFEDDYS